MNQINWKRVWATVGVAMGVLIIGFLVWYLFSKPSPVVQKQEQKLPGGLTAEDLKKIPVPEPGEKVEQKVAVPKEAVKAGPETESKLRIFEIKGENGTISPVMFRAYQNDIINIKLTAVDKDYELRLEGYNLEVKAQKGETKTIEFQVLNPGVFNLYCSECRTEKVGNVIVVPR
ncbi:MAG: hypothetical protein KatS3mg096_358 [Candidatus Parcubacteria bacterium]|nr:MAG: hypothetical protein KatS3mg096_358 [Candidatus Parcubacteria bacterium]